MLMLGYGLYLAAVTYSFAQRRVIKIQTRPVCRLLGSDHFC